MGQYFLLVNASKKEYVRVTESTGSKLFELMFNNAGAVMAFLCADAPVDGVGHEIDADDTNMGRWVGDDVRFVGDYAESGLYKEALGYYVVEEISTGEIRHFTDATRDPSEMPPGFKMIETVEGWDGDISEAVLTECNRILTWVNDEQDYYPLSRIRGIEVDDDEPEAEQ